MGVEMPLAITLCRLAHDAPAAWPNINETQTVIELFFTVQRFPFERDAMYQEKQASRLPRSTTRTSTGIARLSLLPIVYALLITTTDRITAPLTEGTA
jgi:hypothetical protein